MNKAIVILFIIVNFASFGNTNIRISNSQNYYFIEDSSVVNIDDTSKIIVNENGDTIVLKKRKFTAIVLALLTGPVGGHRLYLGTKPVVPVVYAATLGGGFLIIPIMDIVTIIFTKDLSKFENNDQILMWINGDSNDDEFFDYEE